MQVLDVLAGTFSEIYQTECVWNKNVLKLLANHLILNGPDHLMLKNSASKVVLQFGLGKCCHKTSVVKIPRRNKVLKISPVVNYSC